MHAIIRLINRLRWVNYERLFVGSVLVLTLVGSAYVYLVDVYLADQEDAAARPDPELAARLAPIGRVAMAQPAPALAPEAMVTEAVTEPAETAVIATATGIDATPVVDEPQPEEEMVSLDAEQPADSSTATEDSSLTQALSAPAASEQLAAESTAPRGEPAPDAVLETETPPISAESIAADTASPVEAVPAPTATATADPRPLLPYPSMPGVAIPPRIQANAPPVYPSYPMGYGPPRPIQAPAQSGWGGPYPPHGMPPGHGYPPPSGGPYPGPGGWMR